MTVLLLQPSPTEKLLSSSMFSTVRWIRYLRRLDRGGNSSTLQGERAQGITNGQEGMGMLGKSNKTRPHVIPSTRFKAEKSQAGFNDIKEPKSLPRNVLHIKWSVGRLGILSFLLYPYESCS